MTLPIVILLGLLCVSVGAPAHAADGPRHYAPNGNLDANGTYLPGQVGFNLADVSTVRELNSLPVGVKGLAWIDRCNGVDAAFLKAVRPFAGNPRLFGFYLVDEPNPTVRQLGRCTAESLRAESDWVHANMPGAKTFIVLLNLSSSRTPAFPQSYHPDSSHVDLFGIDPYPCRTELNGCDVDMIDRYVAAAESAGFPRSRMVPVYQTFGGGDWADDGGGRYRMPTQRQAEEMLARWRDLVPAPAFDYCYSWGSQKADEALGSSAALQSVFASHFRARRTVASE